MTQMWRRVRMDRWHLAMREPGVVALVCGGALVAPARAPRCLRPSLNGMWPRTLYQLLLTGTSISTRFWATA